MAKAGVNPQKQQTAPRSMSQLQVRAVSQRPPTPVPRRVNGRGRNNTPKLLPLKCRPTRPAILISSGNPQMRIAAATQPGSPPDSASRGNTLLYFPDGSPKLTLLLWNTISVFGASSPCLSVCCFVSVRPCWSGSGRRRGRTRPPTSRGPGSLPMRAVLDQGRGLLLFARSVFAHWRKVGCRCRPAGWRPLPNCLLRG